jgi:hypothetical protein
MNNRLIKIMAGAAAVVAIALGGMAIGRTGSGNSASATGGGSRGGQGGPPVGFRRGGPGRVSPVTGTAATKVKDAALAKYPGATVERIMQLPDGSYVAHVLTSNGEVHLAVSKAFKVTGTAQGGPPRGGTPPQGTAPQGAPQGGTTAPPNSQSS